MMRTGRILLVEPEEELRRELRKRLAAAGHDAAAVPDAAGAELLLSEGLDPDVIVSRRCPETVLALAPLAAHLALDGDPEPEPDPGPTDPAVPAGKRDRRTRTALANPRRSLLERVEETLLSHRRPLHEDEAWRALDLARRLSNSLPRTRTVEERIDLLTEAFDSYYGVRGTLVIRRGARPEDWIEVAQGLGDATTQRIGEEIARRSAYRDIRPFLAHLGDPGHDVACFPVSRREEPTDLALSLKDAPAQPSVRQALMNLVGSALRAADTSVRLARSEARMENEILPSANHIALSRELSGTKNRAELVDRILAAARRELGAGRGALFLLNEGESLLKLQAVAGFPASALDRIGLSTFHGIAREMLERPGPVRLADLPVEGAAGREVRMVFEVGLRWGVGLQTGARRIGVLLFGDPDGAPGLSEREARTTEALATSAAVALTSTAQVEALRELSDGSLRCLARLSELRTREDRGHSDRVSGLCERLARAAGLPAEQVQRIRYAGLLHDVGKILTENGDDDDDRMHPMLATRILAPAKPPADVLQGIEQHHERWDGHGHPYRLRETGIHPFARIVAIADAYDRLVTGPRAMEPREAVARLERDAGLRYDPGLVAVLVGEITAGSGPGPVGD